MDERYVSEEDFANWIPASKAISRLTQAVHGWDPARKKILDRAARGLLLAAAETFIPQREGKDLPAVTRRVMSPAPWEIMETVPPVLVASLWNGSDITVSLDKERTHRPSANRYYDVRFDPMSFQKLFPQEVAIPKPAVKESEPVQLPVETNSAKPDLAPAALTHWYEAYKHAYKDHERTLDHAVAHAKAAFPEKNVTRIRVRSLMPRGKPGPKPKGS